MESLKQSFQLTMVRSPLAERSGHRQHWTYGVLPKERILRQLLSIHEAGELPAAGGIRQVQ